MRFATAWLSLFVLDAEEKRESVGNSNTAEMDCLKVLGPEPPKRESDADHSRIPVLRLSKADLGQTLSRRLG
jgi:hypothetical protein